MKLNRKSICQIIWTRSINLTKLSSIDSGQWKYVKGMREEDNWRGGREKKSSSAMFERVFFSVTGWYVLLRCRDYDWSIDQWKWPNVTKNIEKWTRHIINTNEVIGSEHQPRRATTNQATIYGFFFIWSVGDVIGHNLFMIFVILSTVIHTDEYIWLSVTHQVGFFCWSKGFELDEVHWRWIFDSNSQQNDEVSIK